MHAYRTHTCGQLRPEQAGETVRLSGWVHRKRDHGNLLFLDLRDHYGLTQCVVDTDSPHFPAAEAVRVESVITITGTVVKRSAETANDKLPTGGIEVRIDDFVLQSAAQVVPLQVSSDEDAGEDVRLRHRFLDLRRQKMQRNIVLRSEVISSIRRRMIEQGFREFQTPILTASSPEGARDFLVPARQHPGKFYALPQAPQQFKQLLMVAGFDRYFQIAPCFRDEDGRADRSPGEFYQLDFEMSYVTQEDVFQTIEPVLRGVFEEFSGFTGTKRAVTAGAFPRIPYAESMLKYGNDKPDLRNPLVITDVTAVFAREDVTFRAFKGVIEKGGVVRAIRAPKVADKPRSFFDKLNGWAQEQGAPGLGYVVFEAGAGKGPIAKFLEAGAQTALREATGAEDGDAVFFVADLEAAAAKLAGFARTRIGQELELIDPDRYEFCWIVDFPMYELNEETGQIDFSHNPFSMPQGGLEALETKDPLTINAFQYDIVCNGTELSSGAIRNHKPEIMIKAFEIAGYGRNEL
ncbi:aspartate--tRNA ligase, partial [Inquilinus sp.]|uniref:aspartate--tRNA ligase n=1 Tax=Inquilinus sp. TaxID=1932117 RepID=UPI003782D8E6